MITPEGIPLSLTIASRGARVAALALDLGLIVVAMAITTLVLVLIADRLGVAAMPAGPVRHAVDFVTIVWIAAMFLLRNAWFLAFELGPRGATPGKRITGIRIAARDGGRLTAEMVIARNLLRDIELFVPLVLLAALGSDDIGAAGVAAAAWFLIFAGMPLFNRDALRAGDLIAGSWVVEAPRPRLAAVLGAERTTAPPDHAYRFGEADLATYGEYELQTLERVLREGRLEAMRGVAAAIATRIGWSAPGDEEVRGFLDAYYAQLRARLEARMRFGKRKADKYAEGG